MLNDATYFKAVYIVCGYTDLRSGMDRHGALVEAQTGDRPYVPYYTLSFLWQADRIKGLVWEGEGCRKQPGWQILWNSGIMESLGYRETAGWL